MANSPEIHHTNEGFRVAAPMSRRTKTSMHWRIPSFRNSMLWISILSLVLRIMSAPSVVPESPHDDLLQVRLALNISKGEWLGSYENLGHLTMVKPPGYPIFLAVSTMLGISPQILTHVALLVVTATLVRQIIPERLRQIRTFVYAIGVLWPTFFGGEFSRYYREGLVYVLTLTVLLSMVSVCHTLTNSFDKKTLAVKLSALGLSLGLILITKPIALAFAPALLMILVLTITKIRKASKSVIRRLFIVVGLFSLTITFAFLPTALVAAQNLKSYGTFQVDSYSGGSFRSLYSAIAALPPHNRLQSETVSNLQLQTLSKVGPYSAELVPHLFGKTGENWIDISCSNGGPCNNPGSWFAFALRDAVALTGEDTSAIHFNDALKTIENEIDSFCSANQECGVRDLTIGVKMPSDWDWFEFANSYITVFNEIVFPSVGTSHYLDRNEISPELYREWVQMPGIPLRDSRSNFTNPVPEFLASLILPLSIAATVFLVMSGSRKKSNGLSRKFFSGNTISSRVANLVNSVNNLGMIIGLGSFLCLTTQLAILQASSGSYLYAGADVYSITCLAPFFLFFASAVSSMLKD